MNMWPHIYIYCINIYMYVLHVFVWASFANSSKAADKNMRRTGRAAEVQNPWEVFPLPPKSLANPQLHKRPKTVSVLWITFKLLYSYFSSAVYSTSLMNFAVSGCLLSAVGKFDAMAPCPFLRRTKQLLQITLGSLALCTVHLPVLSFQHFQAGSRPR